MQKAKCKVLIVLFAYSGNGGIPGTIPAIAWWLAQVYQRMCADERIGKENVAFLQLCDTPITMTRNMAIRAALAGGYDMLLMLDSDNEPDGYLGQDPQAKPFWETAFNLAYERLLRGQPTVAVAPYCGPPQHPVKHNLGEVVYAFRWLADGTPDGPGDKPGYRLEMLGRNEAAEMRGIHSLGAGATGVSLWTTSVFEGLPRPIFDYEYNVDHSEKASTEDVYATRNASLFWLLTKRLEVLFGLFDCWALHHKIKLVGRPTFTRNENIAEDFREAIRANKSFYDELHEVEFGKDLPDRGATLGPFDDDDLDDDDEVIDDDEPTVLSVPAKSNGSHKPLAGPAFRHELIAGRKVPVLLEGGVPEGTRNAVAKLLRKGKPQRSVLVNAGTGELAAVMLAAGTQLYLTAERLADNLLDPVGKAFAEDFRLARLGILPGDDARLAAELLTDPQGAELVVVQARPADKSAGVPAEPTPELLDAWLRHVGPTGVIAGTGYSDDDEDTKLVVLDFAERHGVAPRSLGGGVWAVSKAEILAKEAAHASSGAGTT